MEEVLKDLFGELVKFSKEVSPEIWAILVKQQLIQGWLSLSFLILSAVGALISLYKTKEEGWKDPTNANILSIVFIFIFACSLAIFASKGLTRLLNPAYHALMALKPG